MVKIQYLGFHLRPGPVKEADVLTHSAHYARVGDGCSHTNLSASINRIDGALFLNDDWSLSPHFTASYGLRFESENDVSRHFNWAPRIGISWGLGHGPNTKTVLRAGWGIFYTHLDDDHMMIAGRLNGQNQQTYIVNNPDFFPTPPPLSSLTGAATSAPTTFRIAPNLVFPYDLDAAVSLERQLSGSATASLTYVNSRGVHQFLANDINAPLPGTFNPADPQAASDRSATRPGTFTTTSLRPSTSRRN